jgi:hypothetical protein
LHSVLLVSLFDEQTVMRAAVGFFCYGDRTGSREEITFFTYLNEGVGEMFRLFSGLHETRLLSGMRRFENLERSDASP